jgi:hypothetical protein
VKHASNRQLIDRKWGPAKIKAVLPKNKIKVLYKNKEKIAKELEAYTVNMVNA